MKTFDVTLKGFDVETFETDHLVKWVVAPSIDTLYKWLRETGLMEFVRTIDVINSQKGLSFDGGVDVCLSNVHSPDLFCKKFGNFYQITEEEFDPKQWINQSNQFTRE